MFRTPSDEIPREMSLRLTAIRETFEEAGILILKKNGRLIKSEELPNLEEFKRWRQLRDIFLHFRHNFNLKISSK